MGKIAVWVRRITLFHYVLLGMMGLTIMGVAATSPHPTAAVNLQPKLKQNKDTAIIHNETVTETEIVPYGQTTVDDPTYQPGYSEVTTPGQDGTKAVTYQLTYTDGVLTRKKPIKQEVIAPPVDEVTSTGPYTPAMADPLAGVTDCSADDSCQ